MADYLDIDYEYKNITQARLPVPEPEDYGFIYAPPIIMGIISVFGLLFNAIAIVVNCVLEDYKKTSHWYVLNLAIADSAFLLMLPLTLAEHLMGDWKWGEPLCVSYNAVFFVNYYAGIFFLTVMSFDRYAAILHPMSSAWRRIRSKEGCWVLTFLVWILALTAAMPLILTTKLEGEANVDGAVAGNSWHCAIRFHSNTKEDNCLKAGIPSSRCDEWDDFSRQFAANLAAPPSRTDDVPPDFALGGSRTDNSGNGENTDSNVPSWLYNETTTTDPYCAHVPYPSLVTWIYTNFVLTFLLPILVMIFCYSCILWRVLHPRISSSIYKKGSTMSFLKKGNNSAAKNTSKRPNHRVTVLVVTLVAAFIVCWTPYHAQHLAKIKGMNNLSTQQCKNVLVAAHLMAYCNSLLNPLLYTFLGANFHKRVTKVWNRIKSRNSSAADFFAKFRASKSSERSGTRGSVTSKTTKTTDSSGTGVHSNINMHSLSREQKREQSTASGCGV